MFWKKNKNRPIPISSFLSRIIAKESEKIPVNSDHWVKYMSVERAHADDQDVFDVRIFDENIALRANYRVTDYESLDAHPDLIMFEGWYNKKTKKADVKYKKAA